MLCIFSGLLPDGPPEIDGQAQLTSKQTLGVTSAWARHTITYNTGVQSQKAVFAQFTSKEILPFGFAEQYNSGLK